MLRTPLLLAPLGNTNIRCATAYNLGDRLALSFSPRHYFLEQLLIPSLLLVQYSLSFMPIMLCGYSVNQTVPSKNANRP